MSERDFNIDASTGMPVLPKGYEWHVSFNEKYQYSENGGVRVALRRKSWWGRFYYGDTYSKYVGLTYDDDERTVVPFDRYPTVILKLALDIMDGKAAQFKRALFNESQEKVIKELEGTYPPKVLVLPHD